MRSAQLSFVLFFAACSNDPFNGMDAGDAAMMPDTIVPVIEGGATDAPPDTGPPPVHRVFVANQNTSGAAAIVAWDGADTLSGDRAPDVSFNAGMTQPTAITLAGSRLFVWDDGTTKLNGFDNADKLTGTAMPSVSLGASAIIGTETPHMISLQWSKTADLLLAANPFVMSTSVQMFKGATTLTNSSTATARFGAASEPIWGVAIDPTDRIFLGDTNQGVIRYITGASGKTGVQIPTMDFGSPQMLVNVLLTDGTRLYAGGGVYNGAPSIFIYELANIHPGSTPDVTLSAANGLCAGPAVTAMALTNDILVAACGSKVLTFSGAKTLTGSSQGVLLTTEMNGILQVNLSPKTGLLYTVGAYKGNKGLQVWKSIASSPTLQAEVRTGIGAQPVDIALYEP